MKGADQIKNDYRPYHPWRHGYRREKRKRRIIWIARILLVAEGILLVFGYLKEHTYENVYEREVFRPMGEEPADEGDRTFFGIGFEAEDGSLFWFRRKVESEKTISE